MWLGDNGIQQYPTAPGGWVHHCIYYSIQSLIRLSPGHAWLEMCKGHPLQLPCSSLAPQLASVQICVDWRCNIQSRSSTAFVQDKGLVNCLVWLNFQLRVCRKGCSGVVLEALRCDQSRNRDVWLVLSSRFKLLHIVLLISRGCKSRNLPSWGSIRA
jgi:hypothetical protein